MSLTRGNKSPLSAPRRPGQQVERKFQFIPACLKVTGCKARPSHLLPPLVTGRSRRPFPSAVQLDSVPSKRPGRVRGSKGAAHFTEGETEAG